ncbi:aspartate aminotransferase family protein [Pyrinomonas methylaliphatogenes]|uniref:4-aminobutyrate aminotransferase family protein n=1 Tax=Pyrinomonas methylaliphatogenes TaxID=454194 RepID=A0A0B6WTX4_9BACT|nr:aspartate aminotransferase family protein [Pyrinomonas methylaliphatogenes]CDM64127.1 4-aminobutyrate aminotransferase family protein [Pyrinomonas methylaliphatogenes]
MKAEGYEARTRLVQIQRRASEDELRELEREYCSWGDTVHYLETPKFFARCEGSYLYDDDGRPYLDLQMWYSAASFGYANERLQAALKRQLERLPQLACQYLHAEKVLLAAAIARLNESKFGLKGRVHFNVGGAQAIEDSLKIVRNETGKSLVFAFMGSYHGRTLGASAITSSYRYRRRYGHFSDRAHFVPFPYCFRCPYGKRRDDCGLYCVEQFARLFETEYHSFWDAKAGECEFAAFYIEPIQGTGGYIVPPPGYFRALKRILDEHKILLVDDEIQMGFYRAGKFWAIENFDVAPDIIVFGKALTNGLNPLSGIWAREELISPAKFPPGSTHSTFSSNPLGTAIGLETISMLEEKDYEEITRRKGGYFLDRLRELQRRYPKVIGDVDGMGMALRIEICAEDGYTPDRELTDRIFAEGLRGDLDGRGRKMGLVLDIGGYYKNVFTLAPCFDITYEEIDLAIDLLDQLIRRCAPDRT